MDISNLNKDLYCNMDLPTVTHPSIEDDVKIIFDDKEDKEDDIEVLMEVKKYSTKETTEDSAKITLLKHIGTGKLTQLNLC